MNVDDTARVWFIIELFVWCNTNGLYIGNGVIGVRSENFEDEVRFNGLTPIFIDRCRFHLCSSVGIAIHQYIRHYLAYFNIFIRV